MQLVFSSNIHDFNSERIRIDVRLMLNGYPPHFISKQFNRFFQVNNAMPVLKQLNKHSYHGLHKRLLYQRTRREKELQLTMQQLGPFKPPMEVQSKIQNQEVVYPHYLFEKGLTSNLPKQIHTWWKKHYAFNGSPLQHVKLQLVSNTNRTLETFLIRNKPSREILTRMESTQTETIHYCICIVNILVE